MLNKKHIIYYIFLSAVLFFGIFLTMQTADNRQLQSLIIFSTAFFYVGSGLLHHFLEHDLNSKIVLEYVLMGALGLTVILFFLKGGIGI